MTFYLHGIELYKSVRLVEPIYLCAVKNDSFGVLYYHRIVPLYFCSKNSVLTHFSIIHLNL
jgi:hypothetical protein